MVYIYDIHISIHDSCPEKNPGEGVKVGRKHRKVN
jgi:hypothetical protein